MVLFDRACQVAGVGAEGGISRVWPHLVLIVYGGMNLEPYRAKFESYFNPGRRPWMLQVYPSSEGFIALQADLDDPAMEPLVDNEIFFEFVPLAEWGKAGAGRLMIHQVEPGIPYCLVLSTAWGLWAYDLGDVVRFTSVRPPRLVFAGRHQHFLNAFGEHMIGEEVAGAVAAACEATGARVAEFTAAPIYPDRDRLGGAHEYVVEFTRPPQGGLEVFARAIDRAAIAVNVNYRVKRDGDLRITAPEVRAVPPGTFYAWMKKRGRLGGQNKVPVCANDRRYADDLLRLVGPSGTPEIP